MMKKVVVLGAGMMGSAITVPLADSGNYVNLWGTEYDVPILEYIKKTGTHSSLKVSLPKQVHVFYPEELDKALYGCEIVFIAVTSDAVKTILKRALPYMDDVRKVIILSKGIHVENDNIMSLSQVASEEIRNLGRDVNIISVGGPCIAEELVKKVPTLGVYASHSLSSALDCKKLFETKYYKIITTDDVIGVELCAALKNSYAITIGWSYGLSEIGDYKTVYNLESLLLTQAIKEMRVIVKSFGGNDETVIGPAGLGDLNVTIKKVEGRNVSFGRLLGKGMNFEEAIKYMHASGKTTIEGIPTAIKIYGFLTRSEYFSQVLDELILLKTLVDVLRGKISVKEALSEILENISERG
jgi:glycerol-3-phosphate dehydrogenase (NAD(P)+)